MAAPKGNTNPGSIRESAARGENAGIGARSGSHSYVGSEKYSRLKQNGTIAARTPRKVPARISNPGFFSYFAILFNQLFNNSKAEDQHPALQNLLEAGVLSRGNGEGTSSEPDSLVEIYNTVDQLSINKFNRTVAEGLQKDLDRVTKRLSPSSNESNLNNASLYSQLVVARKLLEIIIVLFEDVQGMDAVNRLVQRNQIFLHFKSILWSVAQSRLAGDRTTKRPPPPPTEKTPPKEEEEEKEKADKQPRPSH